MKQLFEKLKGKKSYLVALAGVIFAITGLITGSLDQDTAIQTILGSLGLGSIRHAIKTL